MKTPSNPSRLLTKAIGALVLPALALTACKSLRYPSLGIDGIRTENATYVNQRIFTLQEEMQEIAMDSWWHATGVALADEQPECGVASYDGPAGEIVAGATVTVQFDECTTGVPIERIEVTFQNGDADAPPTAEAFRAKVRYLGVRSNWIGMDASFILEFSSEGGTDPLAADHTGATWEVLPAAGAPFLIHSLIGKRAAIENVHCEMNELRSETVSRDTGGCSFTMRDGADKTPLSVTTPTLFKQRVADSNPNEGVLRIEDVDGVETVLDAGAMMGDSLLLRTFAADGAEQGQSVLSWDDFDALGPFSGADTSSEDGWL